MINSNPTIEDILIEIEEISSSIESLEKSRSGLIKELSNRLTDNQKSLIFSSIARERIIDNAK
jgi:hypothetical protein